MTVTQTLSTTPRRIVRRAFTLVEILMAVGIIAVLIGISVLAYKHLSSGPKAAGTDVALKVLVAMLDEFKHQNDPKRRFDNNIDQPTATAPAPKYTNAQVAAPPGAIEAGQKGYTENSASMTADAVLRTRQVLKVLLTIPSNKKMFADLPAELRGDETVDGPIILDAYRAPIIYVPSGGLTGVNLAPLEANLKNDGTDVFRLPKQTVTSSGPKSTAIPPREAPFWASAGPDHFFTNGDDNQYSWQK
jgi:prepilin-type N-terminal cleavage/methylation domain-containing protein